jgi:hypothetical protein
MHVFADYFHVFLIFFLNLSVREVILTGLFKCVCRIVYLKRSF